MKKKLIMTKEIGTTGKMADLEKPYNVVGNFRPSFLRDGISIRLNGKTKLDSRYFGIYKRDLFAAIESNLSVGTVFEVLNDGNMQAVGTFRASKNNEHIIMKIIWQADIERFLVMSIKQLEDIFSIRGYTGKVIEYKKKKEN